MKAILAVLLFLPLFGYSQEENTTSESYFSEEDILEPTYNPGWGTALKLGTPGLGLEISKSFSNTLAVRAGLNYFRFNQTFTLNVSSQNLNVDGNIDFLSTELLLDWYPFKKSSFRISAGSAYNFNSSISGEGLFRENFTLGEFISLTPAEVGKVKVDVIYNSIAPYTGIGFGRAVPSKKVSFGFDLGVYYFGSPNVTITATELLTPTSENSTILENNLSGYRWYPLLALKLAFRFISNN